VVVEWVGRHRDGLRFGVDLKKTEVQFSDDYLLLAAHLILLNADDASNTNTVFQAIVLLEDGLTTSKYNFQIRLLLTRLYAKLGAFQKCMEHFDHLEIKYIQHDTLSHYWLSHAAPLGHYSRATLLHNKALKFFSATFRDTSEYLIQAYRFGSFAKIPEFLRLRDRLTHSLQYSLVYVESLIYDLVLDVDSHAKSEERISAMALDPVTDQTNWDLIQDNRDLRLMADWSAATIDAQDERQSRNGVHERAWAKLRHVTHHAVSAAISYASKDDPPNVSSTNGATDASDDVLPPPPQTKQKTPVDAEIVTRLIRNFRDHVDFCRLEFVDKKEDQDRLAVIHPLYASPPSRLFDYLRFAFPLDILIDAFQIVEYVFALSSAFSAADKSAAKDIVNEKMEALLEKGLADAFSRMFDACLASTLSTAATDESSTTPSLQHDLYLHNFSVALEILSLVSALLGACHKVLRPLKTSLTKKAKKKKGGGGEGGSALPRTFVHFTGAAAAVKDEAAKFGERLSGISQQLALSEMGLGAGMRNLSISDQQSEDGSGEGDDSASTTQGDILGQINESYATAAAEMGSLVAKKVTYLTSLTRL